MSAQDSLPTFVYVGDDLARYGFGQGHPFGPDRMTAFWDEMQRRQLDSRVQVQVPVAADYDALARFHENEYLDFVGKKSATGQGFLDAGDTPAFPGIFEAGAYVVGSTLDAVSRILQGECRNAFVPIAGLHHARRDGAAGFCVFNDCGVVIETLKSVHGIAPIAYVDIDAHHGDGVYYSFEGDPEVIFADLHEDGRFLYPGTGAAGEKGSGPGAGNKLNIPMAPGADDDAFFQAWKAVEELLAEHHPRFIILQCGADSLQGDPITHLNYSEAAHQHAAGRLRELAEEYCDGRLLALGGGGYNRRNLAVAWSAVVESLLAPRS